MGKLKLKSKLLGNAGFVRCPSSEVPEGNFYNCIGPFQIIQKKLSEVLKIQPFSRNSHVADFHNY